MCSDELYLRIADMTVPLQATKHSQFKLTTMNVSKHLLLCLLAGYLIFLFSCKKNDKYNKKQEVDVYVAGHEFDNEPGHRNAVVWKNGEAEVLSAGNTLADASTVFVSGSDVYVAGYDQIPNTTSYLGRLWKNGSNIIESASTESVSSVYVSGSDVYYAGSDNGVPRYWKNGNPVTLETEADQAVPLSIFVSGSDVYVAGYEILLTEFDNQHNTAVYWKNGTRLLLSLPEESESVASSVFVSGNDVYVAGYYGSYTTRIPLYWKNGTPVVLPVQSGRDYSRATSVFVSGNDIYVVGSEAQFDAPNPAGIALYWKNGVRVPLTQAVTHAGATSIFVFGNDVYVAGSEGGVATYWKNGTPVVLGKTDGTSSIGNSIFVVERPK